MQSRYGSDLVVDVLKNLDIEYIAFNPGISFRGLHESLVNYGGNQKPEIITCMHENIAISLAQGYAKAALKPMAAATHNMVGLLNGSLAVFIDWLDQTPLLLLGGGGPMAVEQRDPIDWHHVGLIQGNAIRDFVKWDDQPTSIEGLKESLYRAYQMAMNEPKGPAYVCIDAGLQEQAVDENCRVPDAGRYPLSKPPQADPGAIEEAAALLVAARRPVIMADYLGRHPKAVTALVELADLLAAPVLDAGSRFNFPNTHPQDLTGLEKEVLATADVILGLDMHNFYGQLNSFDPISYQMAPLYADNAKIIHIGLQELHLKSWTPNTGRLQPMHLSLTGDTALALPSLTAVCREKMAAGDPTDRNLRTQEIKAKHDLYRHKCATAIAEQRHLNPIALPCLAADLWEVVRDEEWVLVNRLMKGWVRRLWDWSHPHQWIGAQGGGSVGYGVAHSIGAALAHKGTGRLCIDIQPDGDFLYTPSALWTAAHHGIPLLVVMLNNRGYNATYDIQNELSRSRGRSAETSRIATQIDNPAVDFAGLARSLGVYGEGPIEHSAEVRPALERAVRYIKEKQACALVDIITQPG